MPVLLVEPTLKLAEIVIVREFDVRLRTAEGLIFRSRVTDLQNLTTRQLTHLRVKNYFRFDRIDTEILSLLELPVAATPTSGFKTALIE